MEKPLPIESVVLDCSKALVGEEWPPVWRQCKRRGVQCLLEPLKLLQRSYLKKFQPEHCRSGQPTEEL